LKLLIDADILLYKAASSVEVEKEFEDGFWVLWTDVGDALEAFNESIGFLLSKVDLRNYALCFSDARNFRKDIYPDYKGNRTSRKPMGFKDIRDQLMEANKERIVIKPGLEADDAIGILATSGPDYLIWSEDKDLRQIPGKHLTKEGIITISEEEGDLWFYTQVLTGDTTDNYKGCPGVGPVKAQAILKNAANPWSKIVEAFVKAGLTEEEALVQARLARILRSSDWDKNKQEVIFWTPTTA
jgi:DNA polymerase-1